MVDPSDQHPTNAGDSAGGSWATSSATRRSMIANQRRDTGPELRLRKELHRRGLRYRVDRAAVPQVRRRIDIVFPSERVAVLVDGCFWHSCPEHATTPKANAAYWAPKLAANVSRDRDTDRRLEQAGWLVLRVWEHEPVAAAADRVEQAVRQRRQG